MVSSKIFESLSIWKKLKRDCARQYASKKSILVPGALLSGTIFTISIILGKPQNSRLQFLFLKWIIIQILPAQRVHEKGLCRVKSLYKQHVLEPIHKSQLLNHSELEISHDRSIYTTEIGKCCKRVFFFSFF